ncbi:hypothetical protein SN4111_16330 [Ligilactobacillus agilis]|uniref:hypothetical protein n=1 Tax=Ligilactobacillus agilis TaxID=1601 RepID=UPI00143818ED|nr:hypothetical protein [Ligilactobacillus agilis]GET15371.1 hypothetical protein SN4111_16330 [Ligilactobacillus agilis]
MLKHFYRFSRCSSEARYFFELEHHFFRRQQSASNRQQIIKITITTNSIAIIGNINPSKSSFNPEINSILIFPLTLFRVKILYATLKATAEKLKIKIEWTTFY